MRVESRTKAARVLAWLGLAVATLPFGCSQSPDDPNTQQPSTSGTAGVAANAGPPFTPGSGGVGGVAGSVGRPSAIAGSGGTTSIGTPDASTAVPPGPDAAVADADADAGPRDAATAPPDAASGRDAGAEPDAAPPADDDRCSVAVYDPQNPPRALDVSGNLGTHDPAVIAQDGVFYLHQTGPRIPGKRSSDLRAWQAAGSALGNANPAWVAREVPEARDLWAPDLSFFGGQYHLYYSASSFGSNYSCIGHATRARMDSGSWTDHGSVVCSNHGSNDNWNAIDPNAVVDQDGKAYLMFGSFWDGIKAIELTADGARSGSAVHAIASRGGGAIEAPFVVRRCGYYYLFVSFDRCCNGASSTYNIQVGRSQNVLGPYVDKTGKRMLDGGGTQLVTSGGSWRGPGHNAVIFDGDKAYNVFHAYRADNGASSLRVAELVWDADGWPISGGP